jgi:hypothetical protein
LNLVSGRLSAKGCRISQNVSLANGFESDILAEQSYLTNGMFMVFQYIFVSKIPHAGLIEIQQIREAQLQYIRRSNWFSALRGLQFGYAVINCVCCDQASKGLIQAISNRPEQQLGLVELPVIIETNWAEAYHFRGKSNSALVTDLQKLAASAFGSCEMVTSKLSLADHVRGSR